MNKLTGFISILFAATLWGLDGVALTPNLYNLSVPFVVFILHLLPFIIMQPFLYGNYKSLKSMTGKDFISLFLISLLGGSLGTIFIVKSLFLVNFNHLSIVVLLQKLQPVFAILLSAIILKERLSKNFYILSSIAIVSGYFLTFGLEIPSFSESKNLIEASIYAMGAATCFGSSTVFGKHIVDRFDFKFVSFFRFGLTALIMLFINIFFYSFPTFSEITLKNWYYISAIVLTTGTTALFFYYFGLKRVKASVASIAELAFPLSAVIFDYFINGKSLTVFRVISMAVMIVSIILIGKLKPLSSRAIEERT